MINPRKYFMSKGTRPRKALGQNFVLDPSVLERICELAELGPDDEVIEIGPGLGALTERLAGVAGRVVAIEKDPELAEVVARGLADFPNTEVRTADALKVGLADLYAGRRLKLVANLPYNIASQVIIRAVEERHLLALAVLMVQREVGERIAAAPGGKDYGVLSVLTQAFMEVTPGPRVPPGAFWPRPDVDSMVIKLTPLPEPVAEIADEGLFRKVVKAAFSTRRKTLLNSLAGSFGREGSAGMLKAAGIDPRRRAETLTPGEFAALAAAAAG